MHEPLRAPEATSGPPPSDAGRLACALDLGWRLAAIYAELGGLSVGGPPSHAPPGCLPAVSGLPRGDRLDVYLRAAASIAQRMGADSHADEVERMRREASGRRLDMAGEERLRARLFACHTKLTKQLWGHHEADGKAFELGTSLFDSWHRVAGAPGGQAKVVAWTRAFSRQRVERMKVLLDDLESRLSSLAVTVVRAQLDSWRAAAERLADGGGTSLEAAEHHLPSQVTTWRQLLTGDKGAEAFLTRHDRRRLHQEFSRLVWRSFCRPGPILCLLLVAALAAALVVGGSRMSDAAKLLIGPLGALGLSRVSLSVIARERLGDWTTLLWNRAMANVLYEATCLSATLVTSAGTATTPAHLRRVASAVTRPLPLVTVTTPRPLPAPEI
jgi:hypothetical protein